MHYERIDHNGITDYASIAHGMPEFRMLTPHEVDAHIWHAREERARLTEQMLRDGLTWIGNLFGGKRAAV